MNLKFSYTLLLLACCCVSLRAQDGVLFGEVSDAGLQEPLPFANVAIPAINMGTTTDLEGAYRIPGIPPGEYKVVFSYLGYQSIEEDISISEGQEVEINMALSEGGVTMDEVVVRGQATGQRAAINQQINSNTIVNVISKEKLQELPDQNAAESVGRLAGVSVYRDGGEGQRISVRGISPRFNAITINGERLPSTEDSERSVDLSMISPDMLAGIELFKAITPDMDGDAVGGTVNFTVAKADEGGRINGRLLSGYNDLRSDYGQFRGNFSASNRFINNKLGIILTGNYQLANRSDESIFTDYLFDGRNQDNEPVLTIENQNLSDREETRKRYGGSATIDLAFNKNHSILLNSSLGRTDRDEVRFRRRYRIGNNYQEFDVRERTRNITLISNNISGEHHLGKFDLSWRGSYSQSDQKTPHSLRGRFREIAAISSPIASPSNIAELPDAFKHNLSETIFYDSRFSSTLVNEQRWTSQLDVKYNFKVSNSINGFFKVGGKYRTVDRERNAEGTLKASYLNGQNPAFDDPELFLVAQNGQILLANFLGDYENPNFYGGDYDLLPGTAEIRENFSTSVEEVDINAYNSFYGTDYSIGDEIFYRGHIDINKIRSFYNRYRSEYFDDIFINSGDYNGGESILATYLMGQLNLGSKVTVIGGARWEETDQSYTSFIVSGAPDDDDPDTPPGQGDIRSRTAGRSYREWLPMAHLKYKPLDWLDIRGAVTKTLARPNFFNIVPWEYYNPSEQSAQFGDPNLLHTTAWNYDLFVSFYNKFGLFTLGGFYKELQNIDYIAGIVETDDESIFKGWNITEPRNLDATSNVIGVEFDIQTNLSSLDNFLRGLIFSANLTLSRSETFYPLFSVKTEFVGPPTFFETTVIDTVRAGNIVGQANLLANLSVGYELGGFSGRVSMIYQGDALSPGNPGIGSSQSGVGTVAELDYFDEGSVRVDVAVKQKLDKQGRWTAMLNLNNLINTPERAFLGIANRLKEEQFYGMTADLGIAFKFR